MLDLEQENAVRQRLVEYLKRIGQVNPDINAEQLLSLDGGFIERFSFFTPYIPDEYKKHILISGCAVGSELIAARQFNFQEATGTEVTEEYVSMTNERIKGQQGLNVDYYNGSQLPYPAEHFTTVYSGHIIEHTPNPYEYYKEHMRVLKTGGYFFLEFPNRYHYKELHTGEYSLEYLPKPLRDIIIKKLILGNSFLSKQRRHNYKAILETLQPISIRQIHGYSKKLTNKKLDLIAKHIPHPGFVRLLFRK